MSKARLIGSPQCHRCKHFTQPTADRTRVCTAFPEGIPMEIYFNKFAHVTDYPGDHGIHFEKLEDQELIPA